MTSQAIEESSSPGAEDRVAFDTTPPSLSLITTMTTALTTTTMTHMKHTCDASRRKSVLDEAARDGEPLSKRYRSPEPLPSDHVVTTRYGFVPPVVEESDSVILEETEIARHVCRVRRRSKDERRAKLSTPPPTKNVSFGELHEQSYIEHVMPFSLQYVPNHRHDGKSRRSRVLSRELAIGVALTYSKCKKYSCTGDISEPFIFRK